MINLFFCYTNNKIYFWQKVEQSVILPKYSIMIDMMIDRPIFCTYFQIRTMISAHPPTGGVPPTSWYQHSVSQKSVLLGIFNSTLVCMDTLLKANHG